MAGLVVSSPLRCQGKIRRSQFLAGNLTEVSQKAVSLICKARIMVLPCQGVHTRLVSPPLKYFTPSNEVPSRITRTPFLSPHVLPLISFHAYACLSFGYHSTHSPTLRRRKFTRTFSCHAFSPSCFLNFLSTFSFLLSNFLALRASRRALTLCTTSSAIFWARS